MSSESTQFNPNGKSSDFNGYKENTFYNLFTSIKRVHVSSMGKTTNDYQVTHSEILCSCCEEDSDNESIDHLDDVLKNAGTYTVEEACRIIHSKLIKLQHLYIEEYQRLYHKLKEGRRQYIHELKLEKSMTFEMCDPVKNSLQEQQNHEILKALNKYHHHSGFSAEMRKRFFDRKVEVSDGSSSRKRRIQKCNFNEGGVRCFEMVLPMSKFCLRHILSDQKQVLFHPCISTVSEVPCTVPIFGINGDTCVYHSDLHTVTEDVQQLD